MATDPHSRVTHWKGCHHTELNDLIRVYALAWVNVFGLVGLAYAQFVVWLWYGALLGRGAPHTMALFDALPQWGVSLPWLFVAAISLALGDGANDIPMMEAATFGIAYMAKPKAKAAAHGRIESGTLANVLALLGVD